MKTRRIITTALCSLMLAGSALAQSSSKAWEFGLGTSALELTRFSLLSATKSPNGYLLGLQKQDLLPTASLSITQSYPHT